MVTSTVPCIPQVERSPKSPLGTTSTITTNTVTSTSTLVSVAQNETIHMTTSALPTTSHLETAKNGNDICPPIHFPERLPPQVGCYLFIDFLY